MGGTYASDPCPPCTGTCEKRHFLSHLYIKPTFYIYKRTFYQDRLGTNIGKTQKRVVLCAGGTNSSSSSPDLDDTDNTYLRCGWNNFGSENRLWGSYFILILIVLPRQARDKHREMPPKRGSFLQDPSLGLQYAKAQGCAEERLPRWLAHHPVLDGCGATRTF